jgi:uncharacterized membrane protein HdeD (DUF308 family)
VAEYARLAVATGRTFEKEATMNTQAPADIPRTLKRNWGWVMAAGILMVILGMLAIIVPHVATLAAELLVGWLLLIAGVGQLIQAFRDRGWVNVALDVLGSLLYVAAGVLLLLAPATGVLTLTVVLVVLFIADGILRCIGAFRVRPDQGWVWPLVSGLLSILVGVLIWAGLPGSAVWAVGLLVGITLLMAGWTNIFIGLAARKLASRGS